jgi:hypothetical protein
MVRALYGGQLPLSQCQNPHLRPLKARFGGDIDYAVVVKRPGPLPSARECISIASSA